MAASTLFDLFKGLFSRAFWFGAFLPIAIFAVVNLLLVASQFQGVIRWDDWRKADTPFTNIALTFLALVILAYAMAPLIPLLRGVLDGGLLPQPLHDWLRDERIVEARRLLAQQSAAFDRYAAFKEMLSGEADSLGAELQAAYLQGRQHGAPLDPVAIESLANEIARLDGVLAGGHPLDVAAAESTGQKLGEELVRFRASEGDALMSAMRRFLALLRDAREDALHRLVTMKERDRNLSLRAPQATQIGDVRAIVESYSTEVYNIDFSYIWPRLQLVIPKDSQLVDRIVMAQGQIDFAALSLGLTMLLPAIWLPILITHATSALPILLLGAAIPPVALFFYQLLVTSESANGEVVKLAIDKHRLDVLTGVLRQPLPATLFVERDLWDAVSKVEQPGTGQDLFYRHPTAKEGA